MQDHIDARTIANGYGSFPALLPCQHDGIAVKRLGQSTMYEVSVTLNGLKVVFSFNFQWLDGPEFAAAIREALDQVEAMDAALQVAGVRYSKSTIPQLPMATPKPVK